MAIDRGVWIAACLGTGAAAVVLAWSPGAWPVPAQDGRFDEAQLLPGLRAAAAAVDAACARGDAQAFAAATTASHRQSLDQRLQAVDLGLDAGALKELAASPQVDWLAQAPLAGFVQGPRTAIACPRPAGDGAQVLTFEWDGRRWLFDGSFQALGVRDAESATAAVTDAVLQRGR